jgi:hypothetical protein
MMSRCVIASLATRERFAYIGPRTRIPRGFALVSARPARRRVRSITI